MKQATVTGTYQHTSLNAADHTLNTILDVVREGTWDWHCNTGQVDRSPGWYRMLGYDVGIFNKDVFTWENVIHPDDYDRVMQHFEDYTTGKIDQYNIEYRCRKGDNTFLWINDQARIVEFNADGSPARMIGAHENIEPRIAVEKQLAKTERLLRDGHRSLERLIEEKTRQLEQKNAELEEKVQEIIRISNIDSLTHIANRKKFEAELEKEISRCIRYHHPMSLVLFDIDFFKRINDTFGHKTGDSILIELCALISNYIRDVDFFARWGGEEFVIILPSLSSDAAASVAEKLRLLISQQYFCQSLALSCSFGVTDYQQGDDIESLFCRADNALYEAKNGGRNRVCQYSASHY